MAYGIIYKLRAETVKYKDDIKINILKKDYAGTQYDKYLGAGGITLSKEDGGVICGTTLSFTIQADTDFEYINFFESDPKEYRVDLYRNDVLIWSGFLIGDEYREEFKDPPYDVSVLATDSLGLLKNYEYTPQSSPATKTTRIDAIRTILANTGLSLNIKIAYDLKTGTTNIFSASFSDDYFTDWNCYDVLEKLVPPDATITQQDGVWLIRRNEQNSESTHSIWSYTDGVGYTVTTGAGESVLSLAPITKGDVYPIGTAELSMQHAWNGMEFYTEHGKRPSFLFNHDFSDALTHWEESPTTGFVTTYEGDNGTYVKITGEHDSVGDDVPGVYVKQSFPYVSVTGQGFALELKYSVVASLTFGTGGLRSVEAIIKGRVEFTDGSTTYYLDETDGWGTTNKNFEAKQVSNISGISWNDLKIYTDTPPLASGTMTVYLYGLLPTTLDDDNSVSFTDVVVHPYNWSDYPGTYRYDIAMRTNATETGSVTILPTDVPNVANFNRLFYLGQTVSDSLVSAWTNNGSTTGTYVNTLINSMYFLHGTTRQLISGTFRGDGLTLNSVIQASVTDSRKYTVLSGNCEILNDRWNLDLLEIPGSASGSSWTIPTTDHSSSAEWDTSQSSSGGVTSSGGTTAVSSAGGSFVDKSWFDNYFEIVNEGTTGEFIRALRDFASTGDVIAYNTASGITGASNVSSFLDLTDTPDAFGTSGQFVAVNAAGTGLEFVTGSASGGVTDHGALSGLLDNDHPQYSVTGHTHTQYITGFSESDPVFAAASGNFALASHNHNSAYLGMTAKAADSDLLDGQHGSYYSPTTHNHDTAYLGKTSKAADSDLLDSHDTSYFATASHLHTGTYEPAFSKNTAFNKNFGTTSGTVAEGNDSRFHSHTNLAYITGVDQAISTTSDVHFASADVTSLEVDSITDGVLQTGTGSNLLTYSNAFENAVWTKTNCTAYDNDSAGPFGSDTIKACGLELDSASPILQQGIANTATGNHTASIWIKGSTTSTCVLKTYSNAQSGASTNVSVTTSWQRVSVTYNFSAAHTTKYFRIEMGASDIIIYGAQLEAGASPTRYINTGSAGVTETGVHAYGDLRVSGSIVASDEITAFSDARLKHDITDSGEMLSLLNQIRIVDYIQNGDKSGRLKTGVIAQELLQIFPQFVEGNEAGYYSVNYSKLVTACIKAIQELTARVEQLERRDG